LTPHGVIYTFLEKREFVTLIDKYVLANNSTFDKKQTVNAEKPSPKIPSKQKKFAIIYRCHRKFQKAMNKMFPDLLLMTDDQKDTFIMKTAKDVFNDASGRHHRLIARIIVLDDKLLGVDGRKFSPNSHKRCIWGGHYH